MRDLLGFLKRKESFRMDPETYRKNLENGKKMILLDVRTKEEYEDRHIMDSILLPLHLIELEVASRFPDKQLTYIIYCRSGVRSYNALLLMRQMGYLSVFDMGGIINWPFEVVARG
jgi:rhodanese-related sulfurtransferase